MLERIINFFSSINTQDYIIFFISVLFFIGFIFTGIEKMYKAYLGIMLGLFLFTVINLTLKSINNSDIGINHFRDFLVNNQKGFGFYSILLIPILAIIIPLNNDITLKVFKKNVFGYVTAFLFGILFFSFFLTVFLSIINNRFLFSIDNLVVTQIKESYPVKSIYEYFKPSIIFNLLIKYDYLINLIVILFILYKITIGGIVDFIAVKLSKLLSDLLKKFGSKGGHKNGEHNDIGGHKDSHGDH